MELVHTDAFADALSCAMQIGEASFDPVIILDADQVPRWANNAARTFHRASEDTLRDGADHYLARLAARYPGLFGSADGCTTSFPAEMGDISFGDEGPRHKYRKSALTQGERVIGYTIVLSQLPSTSMQRSVKETALDRIGRAAVLVRCRDHVVTDFNNDFLAMTGRCGCNAAGQQSAALGIPDDLLAGPQVISFPTVSHLRDATGSIAVAALVDSRTEHVNGEECKLLTFTAIDAGLTTSLLMSGFVKNHSAISDLICDMVATPLLILDAERRVIAASVELLRMLAYESKDVIGHSVGEFLGAASMRPFKDVFWPSLMNGSFAEGFTCELTTSRGDVSPARLVGRPIVDSCGRISAVVCAVEDLAQRELSEMKFSTLFSLSPIPMLVRDLQSARVLQVNAAFAAMTGFTTEALTGRALEEFASFEPSHLRNRFERDLAAGRTVRAAEMHIKAQDGCLLDVQATAASVQVVDQRCALFILHDKASGRFDEQQMFKAIEKVMSDTSWFSRTVVEKLATVRVPRNTSIRAGGLDDLTKREREVLAMVSHGWSDAEIATRLSLTRSTVRNHVAALYSKIDVHSRSSAIVWARERALNVIHPVSGFGHQIARHATAASAIR